MISSTTKKVFSEKKKIIFKRDSIFFGPEKVFSGTNPIFCVIEAIIFTMEKIISTPKCHFSEADLIFYVSEKTFFASEITFSTAEKRGSLIRHRVAVAAWVGAGDAIAAGGIDQHGGRATRYALRADSVGVMAAGLQLFKDFIGDRSFDVQSIESRIVRPEGSEEVQRLHARPLECFVQVRVPVVPKLHDIQERRQDRLILIVAAGCTNRHKRLSIPQHDARSKRVCRTGARTQLC